MKGELSRCTIQYFNYTNKTINLVIFLLDVHIEL